jgi:hypothetical protein
MARAAGLLVMLTACNGAGHRFPGNAKLLNHVTGGRFAGNANRLNHGSGPRFVGNAIHLSHGAGCRFVGNCTSARIYIRI